MFVDNVNIYIKAGNGGAGLVSFLRAKFLPFGGPDGGDGGKGGDVILEASHDIQDLSLFKQKFRFLAGNGKPGGARKKTGQDGKNVVIEVPVGTLVYVKQDDNDMLLADLKNDRQRIIAAKGGKGGWGNVHFATATRKAPKVSQQGLEGDAYNLNLKFMLLIDVAILGAPNSGKSTLLASISEAKPEIADYPFTTRIPVLGVVDSGRYKCVWAEIPATSEKSRESKIPGNTSIDKLQRACLIIYLVDALTESIEQDLANLIGEADTSKDNLSGNQYVVVINKIDRVDNMGEIDAVKSRLEEKGISVYLISALEKEGLAELVSDVNTLVEATRNKEQLDIEPEKIFKPKPR